MLNVVCFNGLDMGLDVGLYIALLPRSHVGLPSRMRIRCAVPECKKPGGGGVIQCQMHGLLEYIFVGTVKDAFS